MAPIGWTNDDMPDLGGEIPFEQCISEMALAGYEGTEIGNKYPADPNELRRFLDIRGLSVCNKWFSSYLVSKPYEEVETAFRRELRFLKAMGAKVIGPSEQTRSCQGNRRASVFTEKAVFTDAEWDRLCAGLDSLGRIARDEGLKLCFHHHMGTGVQTADEIDRLLRNTDPELVWLLYDSGHLAFAGEDPLTVLEEYTERVGHVHLKDLRSEILREAAVRDISFLDAVRQGVFTVPGDGFIDFERIFELLERVGYRGWMVVEAEQDPAVANPFEYAVMAREYIRSVGGL